MSISLNRSHSNVIQRIQNYIKVAPQLVSVVMLVCVLNSAAKPAATKVEQFMIFLNDRTLEQHQ